MSMANLPGEGSSMEAYSKAIQERVRQLISPRIELNVIRSVLREFLPPKQFESILKRVDDWDRRGRPRDEPGFLFSDQIVCAVGELERRGALGSRAGGRILKKPPRGDLACGRAGKAAAPQ